MKNDGPPWTQHQESAQKGLTVVKRALLSLATALVIAVVIVTVVGAL